MLAGAQMVAPKIRTTAIRVAVVKASQRHPIAAARVLAGHDVVDPRFLADSSNEPSSASSAARFSRSASARRCNSSAVRFSSGTESSGGIAKPNTVFASNRKSTAAPRCSQGISQRSQLHCNCLARRRLQRDRCYRHTTLDARIFDPDAVQITAQRTHLGPIGSRTSAPSRGSASTPHRPSNRQAW